MKGVQDMSRCKGRHPSRVNLPTAIEKHPAFARDTAMQVGPRKIQAHNTVGCFGIAYANVRDLAQAQC